MSVLFTFSIKVHFRFFSNTVPPWASRGPGAARSGGSIASEPFPCVLMPPFSFLRRDPTAAWALPGHVLGFSLINWCTLIGWLRDRGLTSRHPCCFWAVNSQFDFFSDRSSTAFVWHHTKQPKLKALFCSLQDPFRVAWLKPGMPCERRLWGKQGSQWSWGRAGSMWPHGMRAWRAQPDTLRWS